MAATLHTFMGLFDTAFTIENESIALKKIVIPIIQRDYAQGRTDAEVNRVRNRFLNALYTAVTEKPITLDFVYGDIDANGVMTPLDGQQRLTTLFLLHWYAAKKEKLNKEEYQFLYNFSYETRYSARDFCIQLIDFNPSLEGNISEEIIDQAWFPLDWKKDSTIHAMLVMLDAIHDKFKGAPDIWARLSENTISFYFLPIKDMGLTDELYIKMNSRGKPLTTFEHFKAELEHELKKVDEVTAERVIAKIDLNWTDLLWQYRDKDSLIDDMFLRYFRFICDILCYKSGGTTQGKRYDEFELIKKYFSAESENALENMLYMEQCFDCWCEIEGSPNNFLDKYVCRYHRPGKIKLNINMSINIFENCLHNYSVVYSNGNRAFPLNRFIVLYAIITYLLNKDSITEEQFIRRLRIVHNLEQNSEDEISDSEQRTSGNRMPAILANTDSIIIHGIIEQAYNSFNVFQMKEENEKLKWTNEHPEDAEKLYELEDNRLLFGQISILGLEHPELFPKFDQLSNRNWDDVDCAMLSLGDYSQQDRNGWRYQLGANMNISAWISLFHKSSAIGFENTGAILRQVLQSLDDITKENLIAMKDEYINRCEAEKLYDWRYYYMKYDEFRPGRQGKYYWSNKTDKPYEMLVMWTDISLSQNAYQPFLKVIDGDNLDRDDYGRSIILSGRKLCCENSAYVVRKQDTDEIVAQYDIKQNEQGIDTEDRILFLRKIYETLKQNE